MFGFCLGTLSWVGRGGRRVGVRFRRLNGVVAEAGKVIDRSVEPGARSGLVSIEVAG